MDANTEDLLRRLGWTQEMWERMRPVHDAIRWAVAEEDARRVRAFRANLDAMLDAMREQRRQERLFAAVDTKIRMVIR